MKLAGNWNYPTSVRFGAGRIAELGAAVKAAGISRPLLVTDPRLATLPPVQRALEVLAAEGVAAAVFSEVKPNPAAGNVTSGLAALHAGKHDGVVALGGGSALDAGKVIGNQLRLKPLYPQPASAFLCFRSSSRLSHHSD